MKKTMIGLIAAAMLLAGCVRKTPAGTVVSTPDEPQTISGLVVDTSTDTSPYLTDLKQHGVAVVGRYYGRCAQSNLPQKRLVDNPAEAAQIKKNGLGILSVYQYNSNSPCKLTGRFGKKDSKGYPVIVQNEVVCSDLLPVPDTANDTGCVLPTVAKNPYDEGRLDAKYALKQAKSVSQPKGSAIYFGIDFDYSIGNTLGGKRVCLHVLDYARGLRDEIRDAGNPYRIGAYGNGLTLLLLTGELPESYSKLCGNNTERLVDYTWVSASTGYTLSKEYRESMQWHIDQQIPLEQSIGNLRVDYDKLNKEKKDFGVW